MTGTTKPSPPPQAAAMALQGNPLISMSSSSSSSSSSSGGRLLTTYRAWKEVEASSTLTSPPPTPEELWEEITTTFIMSSSSSSSLSNNLGFQCTLETVQLLVRYYSTMKTRVDFGEEWKGGVVKGEKMESSLWKQVDRMGAAFPGGQQDKRSFLQLVMKFVFSSWYYASRRPSQGVIIVG